MKSIIHFAHGNGFPSPCYQQLLSYLAPDFEIAYLEKSGHSPDFPVTDSWDCLVAELIHSIEVQATAPVIGLGHSLGGVLSFMAAVQRPDLFKALILLDSPIVGPLKSMALRLFKALGLIDRVTPAARTRRRKQCWQSLEEALGYFRSKPLFANFTEACLADYLQNGLQQTEQGYSLIFNPEIEYQIYRTIPHRLSRLRGRLQTKTYLLHGTASDVLSKKDLAYMQSHFLTAAFPIAGSHMFPMEEPLAAARCIQEIIQNQVLP